VGIALTFMITIVLPRFSELYQTMGIEIPWITMGLFYFFDGLRTLMFSLASSLLVILVVIKVIQMQPKVKRAMYTRWIYRLPVIKPMFQFWMTHYLSIQLGSLLQAGVPLLQALNLMETFTPWSQLSVRVSEIKAKIMQGIPLYQSIENPSFKLFLPSLQRMVAIGEKTGRLDEMLLSLAHGTEQMIKNKADRFIKSLEPMLIFFIGVMIAVTVIAMFLPMLQLVKAM
jgi:type II secretory pathway component PulF